MLSRHVLRCALDAMRHSMNNLVRAIGQLVKSSWHSRAIALMSIVLASLHSVPPARAAPRIPQEASQISLSGQVDLPRLVDLCAQRLGIRIEYDASTLKGTVTLRV